jgi:hypothetical protein
MTLTDAMALIIASTSLRIGEGCIEIRTPEQQTRLEEAEKIVRSHAKAVLAASTPAGYAVGDGINGCYLSGVGPVQVSGVKVPPQRVRSIGRAMEDIKLGDAVMFDPATGMLRRSATPEPRSDNLDYLGYPESKGAIP